MPISTYLKGLMMDHAFQNNGFGTIFVGLFNGSTEVSGNGYARTAASWAASTASGPTRTAANASKVQFPTPTGPWAPSGSVDHFQCFDAATGGNVMSDLTVLTTSIQPQANDVVDFDVGTLKATMT